MLSYAACKPFSLLKHRIAAEHSPLDWRARAEQPHTVAILSHHKRPFACGVEK
jgi:hypothetical protein